MNINEMRDAITAAGVDVDAVIRQYIACALRTTTEYDEDGNDGDTLDALYSESDLAGPTRLAVERDVVDFLHACLTERPDVFVGLDSEQIGHDFWLTRNRHGAGFWDRGLGERGDWLTRQAHPHGSADWYVGDDGNVWQSGDERYAGEEAYNA